MISKNTANLLSFKKHNIKGKKLSLVLLFLLYKTANINAGNTSFYKTSTAENQYQNFVTDLSLKPNNIAAKKSLLYTAIDNKRPVSPHFEYELRYDNDNYLYGLKNVLHTKDGNDYGCTFMLATDISYLWKTNKLTLSYTKGLYTAPVLYKGKQMYVCDKPTGKVYYAAREIDMDRLALKFRSGDALYFETSVGADNRSRTSNHTFSASGMQEIMHNKILNIHKEYYYVGADASQTGESSGHKYIAAENLSDALSPLSFRFGNTVGARYNMKNLNVKFNFSLGYIVSTENKRFVGPNSNLFCSATVSKKFGKTDWIELLYTQSLALYQTSYATNKQIGYVQGLGFAVNEFKIKPYFILNMPKGRQEYVEFNDTDPLFRIGFMW